MLSTLPLSVFNASPEASLLLTPELRIAAVSDAYLALTGTRREELLNRHLFEAFPDDPALAGVKTSTTISASLDRVRATGQPDVVDGLRYDRPDPDRPGQQAERYWQVRHVPVPDEQGQLRYFLHVAADVTRQVRGARQLQDSRQREQTARADADAQRQRLQSLIRRAPALIASLRGPELVVELANEHFCELFAGRPLLGRPYSQAVPELVEQGHAELLNQVYRTGEAYAAHEVLAYIDRHHTGRREPLYFDLVYQASRDAAGRVEGVLVFAHEVSEQVQARQQLEEEEQHTSQLNEELAAANEEIRVSIAELQHTEQVLRELNQQLEARVDERTQALQQALRETERQRVQVQQQERILQQILGQVPAAVATLTGPEHRYAFFNAGYDQLTGGRARLGLSVAEALPELAAQSFTRLLDEVYRSGQPFSGVEAPVQLRDASGNMRQHYLDFVYQPLLDGQGQPQGILAFIVDGTDKVLSQQQAAAARAASRAADAQLAAQRESFLQVFEQTPACIAILRGPEHRFDFVNPPYQQLFPGRELLGRPVADALPETRPFGFLELLDRVYQTGEPYVGAEMPLQVRDQAGQLQPEVYFTFTYQPYQEQGHTVGVSIFAFDVTVQVRARLEAAAHQAQLQALFEQAPVAVAIFRVPDYVVEVANVLVAQILGRTPEQVLGRPLFEAVPEVRDQGFQELLDRVVATAEPFVAQEVAAQISRDGGLHTVYLNFVYQPLRAADGRVTSVAAVATDVTGQVQARKASEASARQLRLLTDALPVLIGYLDQEQRYRFANRAYQGWFGVEPEMLLGRTVREVVGEAAYENVRGYIERALAGEQVEFEARMPYRADFTKYIRTSYVPDVRQGRVAGFYTLVSDITEQVLAREQVQAANAELAATNQQLTRTNQDLDNFVYAASHDLKQPVHNLGGLFLELSRTARFADPEEEKLLVPMIQQALHQLGSTIDDLAALGQAQLPGEAPVETVSLAELTQEVLAALEPQVRAARARITTDFAVRPTLSFPRANLRTVLLNLLGNSLKYADARRPARIHLSVWLDQGQPVLVVEDNGLGFDAEKYGQELFQLFRRLHQHTAGSGVGLYLVNRIVQANGGRVEVDSAEGEGATFRVWLGQA